MTDLDTSSSGWPTFPSEETLHEAYEVEIKTQNGETVRFGELIAGKGDSITTIVIFGENIPPSVLACLLCSSLWVTIPNG